MWRTTSPLPMDYAASWGQPTTWAIRWMTRDARGPPRSHSSALRRLRTRSTWIWFSSFRRRAPTPSWTISITWKRSSGHEKCEDPAGHQRDQDLGDAEDRRSRTVRDRDRDPL